ncbi:cytochrome c oxidase subunit 3 [Buchnera aphidicola]|uniref:cytochrome c oxidase subunit 3 n=1 Tax=Buchnera aphidicola TaxID=9 RepID=UPI003D189A56
MRNNFFKKNTHIVVSKKNNFIKYDINTVFGFLIYLMSDCILFSVFFSVYFVLSSNSDFTIFNCHVINIYYVFIETIILLCSSFFYSISMVLLNNKENFYFYVYIFLTFILGFFFILMELYELVNFSRTNYFLVKNGIISSFFSLLILHAIHIFFGLIWIIFMIVRVFTSKINKKIYTQFCCLGLFWHFLDIIWIFIFNFIYLFGLIK